MAIDYAKMASLADKLISQNGGDMTFTFSDGGTYEYDPTTGQNVLTGGTTTNVTHKTVLVRYNRQEGLVSDNTTLKQAKKAIVAGEIAREVGDNVTLNAVTYKVAYKDVIAPNVTTSLVTVLVLSL